MDPHQRLVLGHACASLLTADESFVNTGVFVGVCGLSIERIHN